MNCVPTPVPAMPLYPSARGSECQQRCDRVKSRCSPTEVAGAVRMAEAVLMRRLVQHVGLCNLR